MAYNITAPSVEILASDNVGGVHYPRTKLSHGAEGSAADVSDANPLPVSTGSEPADALFEIVPDDGADLASPIRVLDVIEAGDVSFVTAGGVTHSFTDIPSGYSFRCRIARVRATGTNSTKMIGYV